MTAPPPTEPPPGQLLRTVRESSGYSQAQLAREAGVSQGWVSAIERGARQPSLVLLAQLLEVLGRQLTLDAAPLWATVDSEIRAAQDQSVEEKVERWRWFIGDGGFDLFAVCDSLADLPGGFCFGGLTAAFLLGAPVPLGVCDLVVRADAIDAFYQWLVRQEPHRWCERLRSYWWDPVDPHLPGPMRWRTKLGDVTVTFAPALPDIVMVSIGERSVPVVAIHALEPSDPQVARMLRRIREVHQPRGTTPAAPPPRHHPRDDLAL